MTDEIIEELAKTHFGVEVFHFAPSRYREFARAVRALSDKSSEPERQLNFTNYEAFEEAGRIIDKEMAGFRESMLTALGARKLACTPCSDTGYVPDGNHCMECSEPASAETEEFFSRQEAGFARCFEALEITDDRERSWSSLVLAINDMVAMEKSDKATILRFQQDHRALKDQCARLENELAEVRVSEKRLLNAFEPAAPVATLHDDGYFVWRGDKPEGFNHAGWRKTVYAGPQQDISNTKGKYTGPNLSFDRLVEMRALAAQQSVEGVNLVSINTETLLCLIDTINYHEYLPPIQMETTEREVIVPLIEPVSIAKALLGGCEARISTAVGGEVAAFLVNIQLTGWNNPKEHAEGYVRGFNHAAKWMLDAMNEREEVSSPIENVMAHYSEEGYDFSDIETVKLHALRYASTMRDSHSRALLYALATVTKETLCVPNGWRILPKRMTAAMINAWSGGKTVSSDEVAYRTHFQEAWKRVLDAAPKDLPVGTTEPIYQLGTYISNGMIWCDVDRELFEIRKGQNHCKTRMVYNSDSTNEGN